METTSPPITKLEHQYLTNINKLEQIQEKLEEKLKVVTQEKLELTESLNSERNENQILKSSNETISKENQELHIELNETVTQCQEHIDDIEAQNDQLEKENEELRIKILPDEEMLFYYGCKSDIILDNAFNKGVSIVTPEYLKQNKFPIALLKEKNFDGITTTNYKLEKEQNGINFNLSKLNK